MEPAKALYSFSMRAGREGFSSLKTEWEALTSRASKPSVMQTPAWTQCFIDHLAAEPEQLRLLVARRSGELAMVWPLMLKRSARGGVGVRELWGISHPHMTLSDVCAVDEDAGMWPQLWAWLHACDLQWDRLVLPKVAADSALAAVLEYAGTDVHTRAGEGSAWLDCARPFEELMQAASGNHRSKLSRSMRRATLGHSLRYECHSDPQTLQKALRDFMELEHSGWKGSDGGAIACSPNLVEFYHQLVAVLGGQRRCEIDLLWRDDRLIAGVIWFRAGEILALQKIAYDEALSEVSPGHLVLREALQRACADPTLRRMSFITRCAWADGWRTSVSEVSSYSLYRHSVRGTLTAWAMRGISSLRRVAAASAPASEA